MRRTAPRWPCSRSWSPAESSNSRIVFDSPCRDTGRFGRVTLAG
jgi:hypothetical protein